MLKKSARLTSGEVEEVLKKGSSVQITLPKGQKGLISAKFLPTPAPFRAAAVAPKSIAKSAVTRNTLRRAVYRALASLPSPQAGMAVFFVRSIPKKPWAPAFAREIDSLIARL